MGYHNATYTTGLKRSRGNKIIAITVVLTVGTLLLAFYKIAEKFAPGSYPYAEHYEIEASEEALIRATNKFKTEYPEFTPPDSIGLKDGRRDSPDEHWYHVYFYYPKEKQILHTWTRSSDKTHTTFAFDAVNEGTELGNWKSINDDFGGSQNRLQKQRFEQRILIGIRKNLK